MEESNADAKERIMNTVVGLMLDKKDVGRISNREIARLAGVNSALINYYYQSRENLLARAAAAAMSRMAGTTLAVGPGGSSPREKLRKILKETTVFAVAHRSLSEISITGEMKNGNEGTVATILPLLKEICGGKKTELELKLVALQIIIPLQVMLLNPREYERRLGLDLSDPAVSLRLPDQFIDNIIGKENEK